MDENAIRLALLGGVVSSFALQGLAGRSLRKKLEQTPDIPKGKISEVYRKVGINPRFPTTEIDKFQNAAYFYPGTASRIIKSKALKLKEPLPNLKKVQALGMIGYDPEYLKAGILAHEAGHAALRTTKPWYSPSRINQGPIRTVSSIASMFAPTIGVLAGASSGSPALGALAGGGSGLLLGLPTLINEYQASKRAFGYLGDSSHKTETINKNKQALRRAYLTYLLASVAPGAILGGIGGAVA